MLRRVESRGVRETVHSIHQSCGQVFRYGIATGRCRHNPAPDLRGALQPVLVKHQAAILEPGQAGELMRAIHEYLGAPTTRVALLLSALLFQRPGNIRAMEWAELDLEQSMWTIPAAKMKRAWHGKVNGRPHLVPLPPQAMALLRELQPLTGDGRYVFPGLQSHDRPMSENTVNVALRRLGYDKETATAHGFRAMARTLMVERLGMDPEVIEAQLAHGKSGTRQSGYRANVIASDASLTTLMARRLAFSGNDRRWGYDAESPTLARRRGGGASIHLQTRPCERWIVCSCSASPCCRRCVARDLFIDSAERGSLASRRNASAQREGPPATQSRGGSKLTGDRHLAPTLQRA